jgi:hypothetical protein
MQSTARTIDHQSAKASPIRDEAHGPRLLEIFRLRCEARATLVCNGLMPLIEAVDGLQESAAAQGLLKEFGQDSIQQIMAESFGRWRLSDG